MVVVTVKDSNVILALTNTISPTVNEGYTRIDDCRFIVKARGYNFHEVEEVPNEVVAYKYCYTAERGFYINPNYNEEPEPQDEIDIMLTELESEVGINE